MSSQPKPEENYSASVFTNIFSKLNPSDGNWPVSLHLPDLIETTQQNEPGLKHYLDEERARKSIEVTECPHGSQKPARVICYDCCYKNGRKGEAQNCVHSKKTRYEKESCRICYSKSYEFQKVFSKKK